MWTEGTSFLPAPQQVSIGPLGRITLTFSYAGPGLIVWDTNANRKEVRERVQLIARDALKIVRHFPSTEEQADRRAKEILQQNPSLARTIAALVVALGVAVVAIALTTTFATLLQVGATIAVIFAFALALSFNANRQPQIMRPT
jgi:hypothetical protein